MESLKGKEKEVRLEEKYPWPEHADEAATVCGQAVEHLENDTCARNLVLTVSPGAIF